MLVLLDTNLLLLPHQFGVDVFAEIGRLVPEKHDVATLSSVVDELRGLVGPSTDGVAANVALELIREKGVEVISTEGGADDSILEYARGGGAIVGTNDRQLKARLKAAGVEVLCMRGRDHLERV
jgi:rRNA-processing protein FCF1